MKALKHKPILIFLAITIALSVLLYIPIIGMKTGVQGILNLGIMWCPGLAAIITRLICYKSLRGLGWGWGNTHWQLLSYFLPFVYIGIVYGLVWTGMLLNGGHNFILYETDRLMINSGPTVYLTNNYEIGLALAAVIVGFIFWKLGDPTKLPGRNVNMLPKITAVIMLLCLAGCGSPSTVSPTIAATIPLTQDEIMPASPIPSAIAYKPLPALQPITPENAENVRLLRTLQIPGFEETAHSQCSVAFSPDSRLLSGVCLKNRIPVWNVQSGELLRSLDPDSSQEVAVAFNPAGNILATGGFTKSIRLWDANTGHLIGTIGEFPSPVWDLAFSPNENKLASTIFNRATSSDSGPIQLWDVFNRELIWSYLGDGTRFLTLSVDYAPDGKTIACGTFDSVVVLDAGTGQLIKSLAIPDHVGDLAFSPNGRLLATGSDDYKIRLWSTDNYELLNTLEGHTHYVNGVAFSPDGRLIISGSHDTSVDIWDVQSGRLLVTLTGHTSPVLRVAVSNSGTLIASISWDGTVRLWGITDQ
jgi:hypothetical protein